MQAPSTLYNDNVFAFLCQNGHTTECTAALLSTIGAVVSKQYKPSDDPAFSVSRSLLLDRRFQLVDLQIPGKTRVYALAHQVPTQRRPFTGGGHQLVKHSPVKQAQVVPEPNSASGGFASLGTSILQSLFANAGQSELKVTLQNSEGQTICVERRGGAQPAQETPSIAPPATPRAAQSPAALKAITAPPPAGVQVCQSGASCKSGKCGCHHFSPAFYAATPASGARPNLKCALSQDPCRFNLACSKPECPFQHAAPMLRKVPVVQPSPPRPSKTVPVTVLMCGETGSGKSTIINGLVNLCAKSSMLGREHIKVAIPTRYLPQSPEFAGVAGSEVGGSAVCSQTQSCATYNLTHSVPNAIVNLQVIDSPGFSDTRGVSQDEVNMSKIIETVSTLPTPLTSLVLVLNGATSRHTINVRNMISRLRGNMPDAVLRNLVIVCTNCTSHTCNTDNDAMRVELGLAASDRAEFFYIQNSAFSSNPDTWTEVTRREIAKDWKLCCRELHRLVEFLSSKVQAVSPSPPPVVNWQAMREARMRLKQALHAALLDTQQYRQVLVSLDQAEAAMKQNSSDANAFSNFIKRTQQTVTELVDAPYHSTICSSCNTVCHDHCGLSEISNHGDNAFRSCAAFSGDNCHAGSCRCSYTRHYHGRKTMRTTTKTLETVLSDIKAKYDQAVSGKASAASMLTTLASSRANVEQSLRALGQRLLKECEEIRGICSGFNIVDELYVQLDVMRLEASRTHDLRVRDQLHSVIVQVETLCKNLALGNP